MERRRHGLCLLVELGESGPAHVSSSSGRWGRYVPVPEKAVRIDCFLSRRKVEGFVALLNI